MINIIIILDSSEILYSSTLKEYLGNIITNTTFQFQALLYNSMLWSYFQERWSNTQYHSCLSTINSLGCRTKRKAGNTLHDTTHLDAETTCMIIHNELHNWQNFANFAQDGCLTRTCTSVTGLRDRHHLIQVTNHTAAICSWFLVRVALDRHLWETWEIERK